MEHIKQYCGISMSSQEVRKLKRFESVHLKRCAKGRGLLEFIVRPVAGFGVTTKVRCIECGAERDITDVDTW